MFDLHESGENYLETILILEQKNGSVRSIDIANYLNYSSPASAGPSACSSGRATS